MYLLDKTLTYKLSLYDGSAAIQHKNNIKKCPESDQLCLWPTILSLTCSMDEAITGSTEACPLSVVQSPYTFPVVLGMLMFSACFYRPVVCEFVQPLSGPAILSAFTTFSSSSFLPPVSSAEGTVKQLFHHIQLIYCLHNFVNLSSLSPQPW